MGCQVAGMNQDIPRRERTCDVVSIRYAYDRDRG